MARCLIERACLTRAFNTVTCSLLATASFRPAAVALRSAMPPADISLSRSDADVLIKYLAAQLDAHGLPPEVSSVLRRLEPLTTNEQVSIARPAAETLRPPCYPTPSASPRPESSQHEAVPLESRALSPVQPADEHLSLVSLPAQ